MTTWITVCDTCKREGWSADTHPLTDGEVLVGHVEAALEGQNDIKMRRVSCMMGCARACNVAIQGDNKLHYVLGQFTPDRDAAEAIVGYAREYETSETGQVPYRTWPQGVKGHFTSRTLPLPTDD